MFLFNLNSSLCRYNDETDSLDIYQNDTVIGSIFCGFQWNGVIFNGTFDKSSGVTAYELSDSSDGGSYSYVNTIDNEIVVYGHPKSGNKSFDIANPNAMVDLSNYSKIKIIGSISTTAPDAAVYAYIAISNTKPASETVFDAISIQIAQRSSGSAGSLNFTKEIDVSSINEKVYIAFKVNQGGTGRISQLNISSIVCSN